LIREDEEKGLACLNFYGRLPEYPLWVKKKKNYLGTKAQVIEACNLSAFVMEMCTNKDGYPSWHHIELEFEQYKGLVYGLTVQPTEGGKRLYIANDVVVHNCIYAFRGAQANGM